MTTVVAILNTAARMCSVTPPSLWPVATEPVHIEMRDDFLRATVSDCLERVDWPAPIGQKATITGTGAMNYALPADFLRLTRDKYAIYERQRTRRELVPVSTDGEWEYLQELGTAGAYRFFRMQGYEGNYSVDFYLEPETGISIIVNYVSDVWIVNGATRKNEFTDAADVVLLPRRLLETGIVWRFRKRRGLPYADEMAEHEALLARYGNDSRTRRVISFGDMPTRQPWDVPVPDVIPSS